MADFKKIGIELEKVENGYTMKLYRDYAYEAKVRVYFTAEELFADLAKEISDTRATFAALMPGKGESEVIENDIPF